jgi:hypothetical protein
VLEADTIAMQPSMEMSQRSVMVRHSCAMLIAFPPVCLPDEEVKDLQNLSRTRSLSFVQAECRQQAIILAIVESAHSLMPSKAIDHIEYAPELHRDLCLTCDLFLVYMLRP